MTRLKRFAFLIVPLALGVVSAAMPGRAQQSGDSRFAFADTTLLRDTLGLSFTRLFHLADSLGITPDTLRALSVRYRFRPERLVAFSDSMRVPVDSVGVVLERARFNPLLSQVGTATDFLYTTTYNIQQTTTGWLNTSDFNFVRGPLFVRNVSNIQMDRYRSGRLTTLRQSRSANTELGWRITPEYSLGGRAVLSGFDSNDPSSISQVKDTRNEFQASVLGRMVPAKDLITQVNLYSGYLDQTVSGQGRAQERTGLTGDASGTLSYRRGNWLAHDLRAQLSGNMARSPVFVTRPIANPAWASDFEDLTGNVSTHDLQQSVRGNLSLFQSAPIGLVTNFNMRKLRTENADSLRVVDGIGYASIRPIRSSGKDADAALRLRLSNDRYLNVKGNLGRTEGNTASYAGQSVRSVQGMSSDARYALAGWTLEGRFGNDVNRSQIRVGRDSGYVQTIENRNLDGTLHRQLTPKLTGRLQASIGLTRSRIGLIGNYPAPPVPRDDYRQSYRMDGAYTFSEKFNSGVTLDVARSQVVYIPAASAGNNNVNRLYRAEWRWTYRLLRGLTATQRNTISANYFQYAFLSQTDRLTLEYGTVTTLNAVLTPRLAINLTHSANERPSGTYVLDPLDQNSYFSPADRNKVFELRSDVSYTPISGFALTVAPSYSATEQIGTLDGVAVPQRSARKLTLDGRAVLNLPVAKNGLLEGNIGSTYTGDRTTVYSQGVAGGGPRTEFTYWRGALTFTWRL